MREPGSKVPTFSDFAWLHCLGSLRVGQSGRVVGGRWWQESVKSDPPQSPAAAYNRTTYLCLDSCPLDAVHPQPT